MQLVESITFRDNEHENTHFTPVTTTQSHTYTKFSKTKISK